MNISDLTSRERYTEKNISLTVRASDALSSSFCFELSPFVNDRKRSLRQARIGVERALLIWIVDRPVWAFLNNRGRELSTIGENIYMREKVNSVRHAIYIYIYIYIPAICVHKGNEQRRILAFIWSCANAGNVFDDFGRISIESRIFHRTL